MLDIDHLKTINDTLGHYRGDAVIRQVAETLRHCLRAEDSAFRYGGEEFLVLLPNTTLDGAIALAESIRDRVEMLHERQEEGVQTPCTVSLGVASRASGSDEDRDSLCQRADRALYEAKRRGRNRVVHDPGTEERRKRVPAPAPAVKA
jgi:diguanylate cyclase (GGDEF)-like protein